MREIGFNLEKVRSIQRETGLGQTPLIELKTITRLARKLSEKGNISLAAVISIAQEIDDDQILVVNETEYSGAGKHPTAQLTFAKNHGIDMKRGDPADNTPGKSIVIPENPGQIRVRNFDIHHLRFSLVREATYGLPNITERDVSFLAQETKTDKKFVEKCLVDLNIAALES